MANDYQKRFWSKVQIVGSNKCWEWKAHKTPSGYGTFWMNNTNYRAHRVAWMISNGDIPNGLVICHKCDNPSCCNPNHLFMGTVQDNANDELSKGRYPRGENHYACKMSDATVKLIKKHFQTGDLNGVEIAKKYNINHSTAYRIKNGNHRVRETGWNTKTF